MKPTSIYQIRVKGYLEEEWSDWFDGMEITHLENGETNITGLVVDQPALFGLLYKVNSLNLALLSVNVVSVDPKAPDSIALVTRSTVVDIHFAWSACGGDSWAGHASNRLTALFSNYRVSIILPGPT